MRGAPGGRVARCRAPHRDAVRADRLVDEVVRHESRGGSQRRCRRQQFSGARVAVAAGVLAAAWMRRAQISAWVWNSWATPASPSNITADERRHQGL